MVPALLVSVQHLDSEFGGSTSASGQDRGSGCIQSVRRLQGSALIQSERCELTRVRSVHLRTRAEALECLRRSRQRAQRDTKFQQEAKWLAQNKHLHRGRWIALDGDRLLAEGENSKEVFSKVSELPVPPLVLRIEEEE